MKFAKEFTSQMVPEWHEAYLDYQSLKTQLRALQLSKSKTQPPKIKPNGLKRNLTLYRTFSGLTQGGNSPGSKGDIENQVIVVNNGVEGCETMFLSATDEGGEHEVAYFKQLDDEFNKVSKFYGLKVDEVMKEAKVLNKQMEALIALRVKVEHPNGWKNSSQETAQFSSDVANSAAELSANAPSAARACSRGIQMDVIDEESSTTLRQLEETNDNDDVEEVTEGETENLRREEVNEKTVTISTTTASVDILESVELNKNLDTPRSTIKGLFNLPNQIELKFRRDDLRKAELQLKKAFVEFYNKLRLLKSYSFLNILAISKIMKKYDKIASRTASKCYMKMVDNSSLGSSDEVNKLMERVEVTFVKHFSNLNRSKGMNTLRPQEKREKHRVTFSMGFLVGCTFALILALIVIVRARNIVEHEGRELYMQTMFPLYSLFGFIVLHMLMYAGNIYLWRRYRVNYSFILGFKQGTELGYKEVLLFSFCLSFLALASVMANLDMEMDPMTHDYQALTELVPLGLLMLVVAIMLCPFNIMYRSSRKFLLTSLLHCVLAPLYKVTLPDFLLADQLTSQVQALRSLEFYICYYGWGDYKLRQNNCSKSDIFRTFSFIIAAIPFWWRLLQCLRRLREERDIMQGYNGLKYLLTIVAVSTRTAHTLNNNWRITALVASILATILSTYWDIVMDWGLLQRKAKNRWLRDKLLVPYKSFYFIAIVLNILLRLAWMQTVMNITIFSLHRQSVIALVASLEIIRRGMWTFFRLENEHLNNVGKFRAFRSVPLPFNYDDKDE